MTETDRQGFTLIELSIVLVIIGLIIGGVLAGRELIGQGVIRKQISQIRQFDEATITFKLKYNCLPGDCPDAARYGLGSGTNGDGSGEILDPDSTGFVANLDESFNYFLHLKNAHLITFEDPDGLNLPIPAMPGIPDPNLSDAFCCGRGRISIVSAGGRKDITTDARLDRSSAHSLYLTAALDSSGYGGVWRASDAYAIDRKLDDGLPESGSVLGPTVPFATLWFSFGYSTTSMNLNGDGSACINDSVTPPAYKILETSTSGFALCSPIFIMNF